MERIDFRKQNIPFTQVANGVLYDTKLSLGAKTVYAFMYSKPDGWQFSAYRIGQELHVTEHTVLKHISELKKLGYLLSKKLPDGRMLYKVMFPPINSETVIHAEIPESTNIGLASDPNAKICGLASDPNIKKPRQQKTQTAKFSAISNKDIIIIKNTSNKEIVAKRDAPFSLEKQIQKMEDSERRDLNIIALYFEHRKPNLQTKEQFIEAIRRHLKPANQLKHFSDEQILKALDYAKKEYKSIYTLETLLKILVK